MSRYTKTAKTIQAKITRTAEVKNVVARIITRSNDLVPALMPELVLGCIPKLTLGFIVTPSPDIQPARETFSSSLYTIPPTTEYYLVHLSSFRF